MTTIATGGQVPQAASSAAIRREPVRTDMSPPSLKRASVCASLSAAEASQIAPSLGAVMHPVREPTPSSASIVNVHLVDPLARVTVILRILYVVPQISVRATSKIGRDKQG